MNNSIYRVTGKTLYELVYGQKLKNNFVWLDTLFEQNNNVLNEEDIPDNVEIEQEINNFDVNIDDDIQVCLFYLIIIQY